MTPSNEIIDNTIIFLIALLFRYDTNLAKDHDADGVGTRQLNWPNAQLMKVYVRASASLPYPAGKLSVTSDSDCSNSLT
jgi:hypothetical protein